MADRETVTSVPIHDERHELILKRNEEGKVASVKVIDGFTGKVRSLSTNEVIDWNASEHFAELSEKAKDAAKAIIETLPKGFLEKYGEDNPGVKPIVEEAKKHSELADRAKEQADSFQRSVKRAAVKEVEGDEPQHGLKGKEKATFNIGPDIG